MKTSRNTKETLKILSELPKESLERCYLLFVTIAKQRPSAIINATTEIEENKTPFLENEFLVDCVIRSEYENSGLIAAVKAYRAFKEDGPCGLFEAKRMVEKWAAEKQWSSN